MYIMNFEFQKFKKAVENRLNALDNKINNLSVEDIIDNHVNKFQANVKAIDSQKTEKETMLNILKEEKAQIDAICENNKVITTQIEEIKTRALSIDIKSVGDTQRFIEELRKGIVVYNKEKYDQTVHMIDKLETDLQQHNSQLNAFNTKIAKFEGVKTALHLNGTEK